MMNQANNEKSYKTAGDLDRQNTRHWWIDYLRIAAVLLLVPFHVISSYGISDVIVKNPEISWQASLYVKFHWPWHMQLLFLLAGFSIPLSLQKREIRAFIKERLARLLVPLLFGLFFWLTFIGWIQAILYCSSFPSTCTIPGYFEFYGDWWLEGYLAPHHLWFLVYLLPMSIAGGVFYSITWLNERGEKHVSKIDYYLSPGKRKKDERSYSAYLKIVIPWAFLSLVVDVLPVSFSSQNNQLVFFMFGLVLARDTEQLESLQKHAKWSLPLGFTFLILWTFSSYFWPLMYFGSWFFISGLIGLARKNLTQSSPTLKYLVKAGMPVYVIHYTLQTITGYFILPLPLDPVIEGFLLIAINFVLSFLMYEGIRRIKVTRILFGMRECRIGGR